MRKESAIIRKCSAQLTALGLDNEAVFHKSKLILKIYRDVVWSLSERAEVPWQASLPWSIVVVGEEGSVEHFRDQAKGK